MPPLCPPGPYKCPRGFGWKSPDGAVPGRFRLPDPRCMCHPGACDLLAAVLT